MTLQQIVQQRNITRLFHFTHSDNLSSIITHGLIARDALNNEGIEYNYNDDVRLDGHLNANCLSISYPNAKMFFKYRNERQGNWVLLEIKPTVLWEKDCSFYPTNAASNSVRFNDILSMKSVDAFNSMFSKQVFAEERPNYLTSEYTTDVQAEILVCSKIEPSYFLNVYHPNKSSADHFYALHPTINHRYYANLNGRTLYSQRHYYLG